MTSNQNVIEKFLAGETKEIKSGTMTSKENYFTKNKNLLSYATIIAEQNDKEIIINATKYSVTTSKQTSQLFMELKKNNKRISVVTNVKMYELDTLDKPQYNKQTIEIDMTDSMTSVYKKLKKLLSVDK